MNEAISGTRDEPLNRTEATRIVLGVLLLAVAAFTLLSFVSHLLTGGVDHKVLQGGYIGDAKNWAGYVGAWWSDYWITRNFGLGAFFIPMGMTILFVVLKLTGSLTIGWGWIALALVLDGMMMPVYFH